MQPDALGRAMARLRPTVRHDLSASECTPPTLAALLDLADDRDRRRWESLALGYTAPDGAPWLRAAIAARHRDLDADGVVCCAGAQEALCCVVHALLAPGDHAIVALPIYGPSEAAVTDRCRATGVVLEEQGGLWRLDPERVAAAIRPETRLLLLNFPNSPTGASIDADALAALIALCRRHGLWLVNDEVYRRTDSDPDGPPRICDLYERGITLDAMSKGFGLPGLRVGWLACRDRALLDRATRAKAVLSGCVSAPGEVLAHVALAAEARIIGANRSLGLARLDRLRGVLARRPDLFELPPVGNLAFGCPRYRGADGAQAFAARLAREHGVLVLHAGLWSSALAEVPVDRLRIGLCGEDGDTGLDALADALPGL